MLEQLRDKFPGLLAQLFSDKHDFNFVLICIIILGMVPLRCGLLNELIMFD